MMIFVLFFVIYLKFHCNMQVYLEVPNGEKLAVALQSKVLLAGLIKYSFRSSVPGIKLAFRLLSFPFQNCKPLFFWFDQI